MSQIIAIMIYWYQNCNTQHLRAGFFFFFFFLHFCVSDKALVRRRLRAVVSYFRISLQHCKPHCTDDGDKWSNLEKTNISLLPLGGNWDNQPLTHLRLRYDLARSRPAHLELLTVIITPVWGSRRHCKYGYWEVWLPAVLNNSKQLLCAFSCVLSPTCHHQDCDFWHEKNSYFQFVIFMTVNITFLLFGDHCGNGEESCTTTATSDHLGAVLEHSRAQSDTDVDGNKYLLCVCVCVCVCVCTSYNYL